MLVHVCLAEAKGMAKPPAILPKKDGRMKEHRERLDAAVRDLLQRAQRNWRIFGTRYY